MAIPNLVDSRIEKTQKRSVLWAGNAELSLSLAQIADMELMCHLGAG